MKPKQTLADRIYIARAMDGRRTLKQFAAEINYNPNSVCQWEKGHRVPTVDAVIAIAKATNVRLDWLLEGVGEPRAHA